MVKLQTVVVGLCASAAAAGETRDFHRGGPSPDLPLSHPALRRSTYVEQVHVTGGNPGSVVITWVTNTTSRGTVTVCKTGGNEDAGAGFFSRRPRDCKTFAPKNEAFSFLLDPPSYYPGESTCIGPANYTNPECYYQSGVVHSAYVRDTLQPGTAYSYSFSDDAGAQSFGFTTPPAVGADVPVTFSVVGDLGQTGNSSATLDGIYSHAVANKVRPLRSSCVRARDCVCACGRRHGLNPHRALLRSFVPSLLPSPQVGHISSCNTAATTAAATTTTTTTTTTPPTPPPIERGPDPVRGGPVVRRRVRPAVGLVRAHGPEAVGQRRHGLHRRQPRGGGRQRELAQLPRAVGTTRLRRRRRRRRRRCRGRFICCVFHTLREFCKRSQRTISSSERVRTEGVRRIRMATSTCVVHTHTTRWFTYTCVLVRQYQFQYRYPNDYDLSGSDSYLWFSFDTGSVHVLSLCSYAGFGAGSDQYEWLLQDLANIDRTKTPWVVAMWHTPWYTSNAHHPRSEGATMMAVRA
jgi:hypothetical protein